MAWTETKSKVVAAVLGVAVIAAAVAVKMAFFPPVKDGYFALKVSIAGDQRQRLQMAIRQKLGLGAKIEMRDTQVLALKAPDASQLRLTVSDANARQNANFDNGQLHFTHVQMQDLVQGLEQATKLPVVDKTGLTNYYDFSIDWGPQTQRRLENEATAKAAVEKIINDLSLVTEPDEDRTEMLVVGRGT